MADVDSALLKQLEQWLAAVEGERIEFKEAKNRFSFDDLAQYCCALANEGGGRVILGATNKHPRTVVGTQAFPQPEEVRRALLERIPLRIEVAVIAHPYGRVLVFEIPSRPVGTPVKYGSVYWARRGDSLVSMSEEALRRVFAESGHDFSADVCSGAGWQDLDSQAVEEFRRRWMGKSKNESLERLSIEQLLRDAEVVTDQGVTYASLVLFGTRHALGIYLGQAEVILEYRSSDASGPAQQRKEYRQGFFSWYDDLWQTINLRNDLQHYQAGLFVLDIPTFDERSVREAILNAISHRDYQLGGSVFIRQYPRRLVVETPGGFPVGITVENILDRQSPRNRRIADVFAKSGLVERSGQGMNLMFEQSIRQGKSHPDFTGTDAYHVAVTLHGQVQDPQFVQFLEQTGRETTSSFSTHDFLILDLVHREEPVPVAFQPRLRHLVELGVIERLGRGRGTRYLLSRRFYTITSKKGTYTRKRGLDRETNKQLLLRHLKDNAREGSQMKDLKEVLPGQSRSQIQVLLRELKAEGKVTIKGRTRSAFWYPSPEVEY